MRKQGKGVDRMGVGYFGGWAIIRNPCSCVVSTATKPTKEKLYTCLLDDEHKKEIQHRKEEEERGPPRPECPQETKLCLGLPRVTAGMTERRADKAAVVARQCAKEGGAAITKFYRTGDKGW